MREEVKKFLFIGLEQEKEEFFRRAQVQGIVHFIDPQVHNPKEVPQEVQALVEARKVLHHLPPVEQEETFERISPDAIVQEILSLRQRQEQLQEEVRVLKLERARIEVFGDFSFEDRAYIEQEGKCILRFFCASPSVFKSEQEPDSLIYIASLHGLHYYLSLGVDDPIYEKMIEMTFERSLGELKKRERAVQEELREGEQTLRGHAKYREYLHRLLIERLNFYQLSHVQGYVQEVMEGTLFAIEGWVPANKEALLEAITEPLKIYVEEIATEPTDLIPTYLENRGAARLGEDLVHIYDTPSAQDKDPSLWVLGGFTLFFAFIIGDAGYGCLYLALALFLRYRFPTLEGMAKRALNILMILSVGCILWGTLVTSFFGMQLSMDHPLRRFSLVQWLAKEKVAYHLHHREDEKVRSWVEQYPELAQAAKAEEFIRFIPPSDSAGGYVVLNELTNQILFEMALFVGVIHLLLSLCRYAPRQWQQLGWALFLVGAYLYFPFYLETPSVLNFVGGIDLVKGGQVGFVLMGIGVGAAWILAMIRNGWKGIFEIMTLIQVFADALSYLRLYALGLAGATVAATVNEIASGLPFILAALLILVAHLVNIVLSTMGGVIHGLRLNFLEGYHYSFEGGGKLFQPLKLLKRE